MRILSVPFREEPKASSCFTVGFLLAGERKEPCRRSDHLTVEQELLSRPAVTGGRLVGRVDPKGEVP
jgi:hypothetical protein